jgi:hypothetical protein
MDNVDRLLAVGEVFRPNLVPTITYNPRQSLKLEQAIKNHVASPQEILLVLGPSKSGKTVLINKTIPRERLVEVEGTQVRSDESAFWTQAASTLQLPREVTQATKIETSDASIGSGGLTINLGIFSFTLNRKPKKRETSSTVTATLNLGSQSAILDELLKRHCVLVIDDFHVIEASIQRNIVLSLKAPVMKGLRVVIVGIPHRGHDVEVAMRDMADRVKRLEVPVWDKAELGEIATKGFPALNLVPASNLQNEFATHSYGSPQLMQRFCNQVCLDHGFTEMQPQKTEFRMKETYKSFFSNFAAHSNVDVRSIVDEFRGLKQHRKQRALQKGGTATIYQIILLALQHCLPRVDIEFEAIEEAIEKVVTRSDRPSDAEILGALRELAKIASEIAEREKTGQPVVEWNDKRRILNITDASFAFHVKWGPILGAEAAP